MSWGSQAGPPSPLGPKITYRHVQGHIEPLSWVHLVCLFVWWTTNLLHTMQYHAVGVFSFIEISLTSPLV